MGTPSSSLSSREETCLNNCVGRYDDDYDGEDDDYDDGDDDHADNVGDPSSSHSSMEEICLNNCAGRCLRWCI